MVKGFFGLRRRPDPVEEVVDVRVLVAGSDEPLVLTDREGVVLAASPSSGLEPGTRLADEGIPAYEELRSGFTAVVSHELRTPLARLLALLETALLPDSDSHELVEQAREEVEQIRELIDEVLFLSELESGARVVALGAAPVRPVLEETLEELQERAVRAGVDLRLECDPGIELTIRPRMLRVVARNLAENAIRYAGPGSTFTLAVEKSEDGSVFLLARDDGIGVERAELPRLFERFYRADRARASRGTGLGLAIVKHVVTQAGGTVDAGGGKGRGLEIRCRFPTR